MHPPREKNFFRTFILQRGWQISRTTDPDRLAQFFDSIKPISTNHNLIRIGADADGGYLIPNDLDNIEACFSPGVADVAAFELELANRGIKCFLADFSVDSPPIQNKLFHFEKKYLGPKDNSIFMTLDSWVKRNAPNRSDLILQMDIEGSEYGVILEASPETLLKFRILVIEFHQLSNLCYKLGFELINLSFIKLLKDFETVHIHPNNCYKPLVYGKYQIPPMLEFTFLRKDRISNKLPALNFPHPLDRKNIPSNDDFPLPDCWFR
jgi:hypothetical protein